MVEIPCCDCYLVNLCIQPTCHRDYKKIYKKDNDDIISTWLNNDKVDDENEKK